MKQKIIGTYHIGAEQAQLVLRDGTGGEFYLAPGLSEVPRIRLGADDDWKSVVAALLHEALELCLTKMGCRYRPCPDYANDHASYLFQFTHQQYASACVQVGEYLSAALPELAREYGRWKARKK